jgi:hypothetical protein
MAWLVAASSTTAALTRRACCSCVEYFRRVTMVAHSSSVIPDGCVFGGGCLRGFMKAPFAAFSPAAPFTAFFPFRAFGGTAAATAIL